MIMSGWILPDMYEVKCKSCCRANGHLEIVKKYFSRLKATDYNSYSEILYQFYRLRTLKKTLDLEDFAVVKLGWVKIINSPIKVIFYSPLSPIEFVVKNYTNIGYYPISIDERQNILEVRVPSKDLI